IRPDFQTDPTARQPAEDFLQCFPIRPDSLLQLYLAGFIHHAVPTVAISQIQSNGQFLMRNILALLHCHGANLFHCRSPFYLCLEHVDNLGAYSIPSGDRPSHPIWFRKPSANSKRRGRTFPGYCNFAYSALACLKTGISESASFQRVRKSLYAANARPRAASASAPCEVRDCKAFARATPRCANAPVQQFQTIPLWSRIF